MPCFFGSFFQTLGFGLKARGLRDTCHRWLIFKFLEDKSIRFKIIDPQPDSLIQPKAWGPLHMECEFHRTPYKRRLDKYSGHEHLIDSMQPSKYSEDTFKMEFGRTRRHFQKYSQACNTRLRSVRGLVRPGATGLRTWHTYSRIRDGIWSTPYTNCNYSYKSRTSRNRRKLPE
jgi:hypothetical protein